MDDQQADGFKIDFSDDPPEPPGKIAGPVYKKKRDKNKSSGTKAVIVSVLLFCLLGGMLFFGYYHLETRISEMEDARGQEAEHIAEAVSENIDKRFSAISELIGEPTRQIKSRTLELEKKVKNLSSAASGLEKELAKTKSATQNSLSELQKQVTDRIAGQGDKIKTLESRLAASTDQNLEKIADLEKNIETVQQLPSRIAETDKKTEDLKEQLGSIDKKINTLSSKINTLSSRTNTQVTKKDIEQKTGELENRLTEQMEINTNQLQKKILAMEDQILALEAIIRSLERMQGREAGQQSEKKQDNGSGTSGPAQIIEQEIQ